MFIRSPTKTIAANYLSILLIHILGVKSFLEKRRRIATKHRAELAETCSHGASFMMIYVIDKFGIQLKSN